MKLILYIHKFLKNIIIPQGGVLPDPIKPQNYKPFKISKQLKQPVAKAAATNLFTLNPYALPIPPQPKSNKKTLKSGITTLTQRTLASGQIVSIKILLIHM